MIGKVTLFLALVCCATAAIDNCKQGGEYCLNHWDCCSNTCLSYLYKCSRIEKPQMMIGSAVVQSAPALFAPAAIPTISPSTISLDDLFQLVFRPLAVVPKSGREVNALESRLGEDKFEEYETTTLNPTTDAPECKQIGEKCYRHEECCTERCHGFLHQCVT